MDYTKVGLTQAEAKALYDQGKGNVQIENIGKTTKAIIRENIFTYFNLIFFIMAVLLVISGAWNSLTFLPVIICNALIAFYNIICYFFYFFCIFYSGKISNIFVTRQFNIELSQ